MQSKDDQGHKGGFSYNGGVGNSSLNNQGPQKQGLSNKENQNPNGNYDQRQDKSEVRPKEGYEESKESNGGQKQYRKDDGYYQSKEESKQQQPVFSSMVKRVKDRHQPRNLQTQAMSYSRKDESNKQYGQGDLSPETKSNVNRPV
jgi:hypothetical protein